MRYAKLCEVYHQLENTSKRIEKTTAIAQLLKKTDDDALDKITLLLQGKVFPSYDDQKIGIASKLVVKALQRTTGLSAGKITALWKKTGDLGETAEQLTGKKTQATLTSSHLTVDKVFSTLQKLTTVEGKGSVDLKMKMVAELLSSASPLEAKYVVRTLLEDLRVGVGDGTLRDSVVEAFLEDDREKKEEYKKAVEQVQHAFDVTNNFGTVAKGARHGKLKEASLTIGRPIKVMLFLKVEDFKEAFERVSKPAAIEYKYDGFRVQVHKDGKKVRLFTRRLEEVTTQFPEVVQWLQKLKAKTCVLDGEIIGIDKKSKTFLPFQQISQRIKRKHHIEKLVKDLPVVVRFFDLMEKDNTSYLDKHYEERWKALKQTVEQSDDVHLAEHKTISTEKDAEAFFKDALHKGNEGVMMKKLDAPYKPGARVGYGVKVKTSMEELDLVIVGADWGEGKRGKWLASFLVACKDGKEYKEVGKVGTGVKEKPEEGLSFGELTKLLKPLIIEESGRSVKVKPKIILEVQYEEIQASPSYASGFALRFPRVMRLRDDKPISEIATLHHVKELYEKQ